MSGLVALSRKKREKGEQPGTPLPLLPPGEFLYLGKEGARRPEALLSLGSGPLLLGQVKDRQGSLFVWSLERRTMEGGVPVLEREELPSGSALLALLGQC